VVHVEFFATKKEALVRETYLKSGAGSERVGSQVVFD
jgi:hypothetical protein